MKEQDKKFLYGLIIGTVVLLVGMYYSRRVLTPFMIAFALAYLMDPIVDKLEAWKLPRTLGVIVLMTGFFVGTFLTFVLLIPLLRVQIEHLAQNLPDYMGILQGWLHPLVDKLAGFNMAKVKELLKMASEQIGNLPVELLGSASGLVWTSINRLVNLVMVMINIVIIPVAMFYLLRDYDIIVAKVGDLIPPRFRKETGRVFRDIDEVLSSFVRGQLMVATLMAVFYCIGLYFCGTPMSLFIGVIAGYANLVPYLGLVIGFIPAILLTFLQFQELTPLLGVVAVFAVVQALEGMVITPRVVGDQLGLHPVAVMLAVLIGAELFGLVGVLLAVPVVAVLNVLLRRGIVYYRKSEAFT